MSNNRTTACFSFCYHSDYYTVFFFPPVIRKNIQISRFNRDNSKSCLFKAWRQNIVWVLLWYCGVMILLGHDAVLQHDVITPTSSFKPSSFYIVFTRISYFSKIKKSGKSFHENCCLLVSEIKKNAYTPIPYKSTGKLDKSYIFLLLHWLWQPKNINFEKYKKFV